jgi:hypothetical protein
VARHNFCKSKRIFCEELAQDVANDDHWSACSLSILAWKVFLILHLRERLNVFEHFQFDIPELESDSDSTCLRHTAKSVDDASMEVLPESGALRNRPTVLKHFGCSWGSSTWCPNTAESVNGLSESSHFFGHRLDPFFSQFKQW